MRSWLPTRSARCTSARSSARSRRDRRTARHRGARRLLRRLPGPLRHRPSRRPRRDRLDHRGERCRQVDAAQDDRRSRADRFGDDHLRRHVARRVVCPSSRRAGDLAGARGTADLPVADRRGEPRRRLVLEAEGALGQGAGGRRVSLARPAAEAQQCGALGRRAAGAGHRPGAHVEPRSSPARRGVAGPGADRREAGVPGDPGDQGARHDGAARRAGREPGALGRRSLLLLARGPRVAGRRARARSRRSRSPRATSASIGGTPERSGGT